MPFAFLPEPLFAFAGIPNENDWPGNTTLLTLFALRGDTYLRAGKFQRAVAEFERVFRGMPDLSGLVDRWRLLEVTAGASYFLDVRSVNSSNDSPSSVWLKVENQDMAYSLQAYEVDCIRRRLRQVAEASYSSDGQLLQSIETALPWQRVIPETIGEVLSNGMCEGSP